MTKLLQSELEDNLEKISRIEEKLRACPSPIERDLLLKEQNRLKAINQRIGQMLCYFSSDITDTAKADSGKPKLTLVPRKILTAIARIREYGCQKYGDPENWKQVEPQRFRDAAFRHFVAYLDDPSGMDEESSLPHLWHLACNIAFLCEMEDEKNEKNRN